MQKRAFTLIELLIVITIIGILAVAFLPRLLNAPSQARDRQRVEDVTSIAEYIIAEVNTEAKRIEMMTSPLDDGWRTDTCINHINLEISAFGGELPEDPATDELTSFWGDSCGDLGGYRVRDLHGTATSNYRFTVSAQVENFENANSTCDATVWQNGEDLVDPDPDDAYNCFILLIQ